MIMLDYRRLLDKDYLSKQEFIGEAEFLSKLKTLEYSVETKGLKNSTDLYIKWKRFLETNANKTVHERYLQQIIPLFNNKLELLEKKEISVFEFQFSLDCLYNLYVVEETKEFLIAIRFYDIRRYRYAEDDWSKIWTK